MLLLCTTTHMATFLSNDKFSFDFVALFQRQHQSPSFWSKTQFPQSNLTITLISGHRALKRVYGIHSVCSSIPFESKILDVCNLDFICSQIRSILATAVLVMSLTSRFMLTLKKSRFVQCGRQEEEVEERGGQGGRERKREREIDR